ncbi:MAG TPA: hypothetical protein VFY93_05860 [Planctomycetota bacterium]|nr:hypothetical protein [Planctomycetota bacterium]
MPPMERARLYRVVFALAALHNAAFGLWAALRPASFFDLFELPPPRYPGIWQCLGMVIGLYGLLYAQAARRLETARPVILVGLLGKLLGPLGWALAVRDGAWPARTLPLIVFNDLVWWLPFALFLLEGTRLGARARAAAPAACAAANALAFVALAGSLRHGTELVPVAERAAFIEGHPFAWRAGWAVWMAAALTLLLFYAWWACRVPARAGVLGLLVATAGACCDLSAESLFVGWLPRDLERIQAAGTFLTGGMANGLYTLGGIVLTLATPGLRGGLRLWAWLAWGFGIALSVFAFAGLPTACAVSATALFLLFCPWVWVAGRALR